MSTMNWDTEEAADMISNVESLYLAAHAALSRYDVTDLDDSGTLDMIRDDLAPIVEGIDSVDAERVNWHDLASYLMAD